MFNNKGSIISSFLHLDHNNPDIDLVDFLIDTGASPKTIKNPEIFSEFQKYKNTKILAHKLGDTNNTKAEKENDRIREVQEFTFGGKVGVLGYR